MLKISLIFGGIAGLVVIAVLLAGITVLKHQSFVSTEWFGYLTMLVALSMIFLGVKRYRDNEKGGVIKFLPAFGLGLGIATVAGVIYVGVWEGYLAATGYHFMDSYVAQIIAAKRAAGVTGAALAAEIAKMQEMKAQYANPLYRLPMTFLEIFPVGLIVALISAAVLRNPRILPARA
ncbi:MAG TPA: DUF4199 domain-containing protein [Rhizomicrobium sp.]